tara:strand:+ start:3109 stop:3210 length:102 start_codon:yes stop_codon:yes gene_type:complete
MKRAIKVLNNIGENIWTVEGEAVLLLACPIQPE